MSSKKKLENLFQVKYEMNNSGFEKNLKKNVNEIADQFLLNIIRIATRR